MICCANQLAGFYMRATLTFNRLILLERKFGDGPWGNHVNFNEGILLVLVGKISKTGSERLATEMGKNIWS